jgi:hypothetical protein
MIPKSVQRFSEKIMLKQRLHSDTSPIKVRRVDAAKRAAYGVHWPAGLGIT